MDDFQTDLRVYHGLRVFAQAYRPFVEHRMSTTFGPRWITRASLANGSDANKPLDSYALLRTTIDRWNEAFRAVLTPNNRNRLGLVLEARNRIAHEDPIENHEAIGFLSAMAIVAQAVGKMEEHNILEELANQQINATTPNSGSGDRVSGGDVLPIELAPEDLQEFKKQLLSYRRAWIVTEYMDGRLEEKIWIADRMTQDSDVIGNLRGRPAFRQGRWQKLGIKRVKVKIDK